LKATGRVSFEDFCIKMGLNRLGMKHFREGVVCLAEKEVPTQEGMKHLMYWAYGKNADNLDGAQEIYYDYDVPESFRQSMSYDDAEGFLQLRDYAGDRLR